MSVCQHRISYKPDAICEHADNPLIEDCNCAELQQRIAELELIQKEDGGRILRHAKRANDLEQQLAAARSAVEKAPHDPTCRSISAAFIRFDAELREKFGQTIDVTCNCWQRDTLALLKGE